MHISKTVSLKYFWGGKDDVEAFKHRIFHNNADNTKLSWIIRLEEIKFNINLYTHKFSPSIKKRTLQI